MLLCGVSAAGGGATSWHSANAQHEHTAKQHNDLAVMSYQLTEHAAGLKELREQMSGMHTQLIRISVQMGLETRGTD